MTDPFTFALAAFVVLAAPGPTNTLLATSGAAAGFRRSSHLIAAAVIGYATGTTLLARFIGPLVSGSDMLNTALRVVCAAYLFYAAWKLWREGAASIGNDKPVSLHRVLIATTLNPKNIVFAFVIVPYLSQGTPTLAAPYMVALGALTAIAAGGWIAGGAALRAGARSALEGGVVRRAGAVTLGVFATLMTGSAFTL